MIPSTLAVLALLAVVYYLREDYFEDGAFRVGDVLALAIICVAAYSLGAIFLVLLALAAADVRYLDGRVLEYTLFRIR